VADVFHFIFKPFTSLWVLLVLPGCAPKNSDTLHFLREHEHQVSAIEYRVGIPDALTITAPRILEIDGESQRIRPDGRSASGCWGT